MMGVRIRRVRYTDTTRIAEVHVNASKVAFEGLMSQAELNCLCSREMARRWAPLTLAHDGGFFVAEDDELVGFCLVTSARSGPSRDAAEIMAIYVDPERQSEGIGTKLMDAALEYATIKGFTEVMLWVLPGNERARRFYESFGFDTDHVTRSGHGLRTTAPHLEYRLSLAAASACMSVHERERLMPPSPATE